MGQLGSVATKLAIVKMTEGQVFKTSFWRLHEIIRVECMAEFFEVFVLNP